MIFQLEVKLAKTLSCSQYEHCFHHDILDTHLGGTTLTILPAYMTLEPHIPAWKRLGLKLKFAKDEPPLDPPLVHSKKRKAEDALLSHQDDKLDRTSRFTKKAKASSASAANGHKAVNREDEQDEYNVQTTMQTHANGGEEPAKASTATKPKPRDRKSVSFTPGTKEADGQSMKNLYQAWVKTQQNGIDSEDGTAQNSPTGSIFTNKEVAGEPEDGQSVGEATLSPEETVTARIVNGDVSSHNDSTNDITPPTPKKSKKKKKKGTKKSKTTRLTFAPSSSTDPPPDASPATSLPPPPHSPSSHPNSQPSSGPPATTALTYLTTFHTSPTTWKFSKNHQTYLLKHILSLVKIPPKYDPALLAYLKGLQGRAAKGDLRKRAREAREADEMWLAGRKKGNEDDEGGEDTVAGMEGSSKEQYESRWRRELTTILRNNNNDSEQQAGPPHTETNTTDTDADNEEDDKAKALKWRTNRRIRAEIILVAVGAEASPSPEPAPKPSSSSAAANDATTVHSAVAPSNAVKQHIKFNDDAGDRNKTAKDDDDDVKLSTAQRDHDASQRRTSSTKMAVNGVHNKPGKAAAAAPALAAIDNSSNKQPKKRKRKRKSRIRTAVRDSDGETSSSNSSSNSSDSSDESS